MTQIGTQITMMKSEPNRSPEWIPFVTQQQRLRNLIQIFGYNLCVDNDNTDQMTSFYYTLHLATMSAPFYTSEKICNPNPKWNKMDICNSIGSAKGVVIRLWKTTNDQTKVLFVWAIELSGLLYISSMPLQPKMFNSNSLVFCMTGGSFTIGHCIKEDQPTLARINVLSLPAKDVKKSGTLSQLTRIHNIQLMTNKQRQAAAVLKEKISQGEISSNDNNSNKFHSATLRRLMHQENIQKPSREAVLAKKKEIEVLKFRVMLLSQEKARSLASIRQKTEILKTLQDENVLIDERLAEKRKLLNKDIEDLKKKNNSSDSIETLSSLNNQLNYRKKQLVSELNYIYPITEINGSMSISNIHLPNSENYDGFNDVQLSVALGFVAHLTFMVSYFFDVPLRYPINICGSRSTITDHISVDIQDNQRMFPLYNRSKNRLEFDYAVYLLNKNIAQLRLCTGYSTNDLRTTLYNCSILLQSRSNLSKLISQASRLTLSDSSLELAMNAPPRFLNDQDDTSSDDTKVLRKKYSNSDPSIAKEENQCDLKETFHSS